jgi:translation initiation factor IF-2
MAKGKFGWGDAFKATMRNLDDPQAAQREIAVQQDRRRKLLSWRSELERYAAEKQQEAMEKVRNQRANGQNVRDVVVFHATILGGFEALVKIFESNDSTRVDIYYSGNGKPDGGGHGHIILRNGVVDSWFAHGADKKDRIQIV